MFYTLVGFLPIYVTIFKLVTDFSFGIISQWKLDLGHSGTLENDHLNNDHKPLKLGVFNGVFKVLAFGNKNLIRMP